MATSGQNPTTKRLPNVGDWLNTVYVKGREDQTYVDLAPLNRYLDDLIRELELSFQDNQTVQNTFTSINVVISGNLSAVTARINSIVSAHEFDDDKVSARLTSINARISNTSVTPNTVPFSQATSTYIYFGLFYDVTSAWEVRRFARNVTPVVKSIASIGNNPTEFGLVSAWNARASLTYD